MARNFFRIFNGNNPVMGYSKTFCIPEAKGLTHISKHIITVSGESARTLVHVTTNIQRAAKFLYCDPRLG